MSDIVKKENNKQGSLSKLQKIEGLAPKISGQLELPRMFYQLVIFVIDASNSMNEISKNNKKKSEEVNIAIKSVLTRLFESKNKKDFDISFIAFSDTFNSTFGVRNLLDINIETSFNPFNYIDKPGGTKLTKALEDVKKIANNYLNKYNKRNSQVLIQILSDGEIDDYASAIKVINVVKDNSKITLACQFFESYIDNKQQWYSWNEATGEIDYNTPWSIEEVKEHEQKIYEKFKKFASSNEKGVNHKFFLSTVDPEEIRKHMIKSISTVSKID